MMTRADAIARVAARLDPSWLVVACNGMISRELYAAADAPSRFYMIGSMGLASSIGLGVALAQPARTVVVFDGDGNVLMNTGVLGSIVAADATNLYHVVFDNHAHASTGGQRTISDRIPLERVALAAGYARAVRVDVESALDAAFDEVCRGAGPAMLLVKVAGGNQAGIGRMEIAPPALTVRFRAAIRSS